MTSTPAPAPKISLDKKGADQPAQQAAPPAAAKVTVALIIGAKHFYQHNYKTILYIVLGQIAVILTLLIMLLKLLDFTAARDYYFPMRENNKVIQELPAQRATTHRRTRLSDWAEEAVSHTLTFGYYDHLIRLQNSRAYFTTPGWADFTKALDDAKVL